MACSIETLIKAEDEVNDCLDEELEAQEHGGVAVLSEEVKQSIEKHIQAWLLKKEFLDHEVSIHDVAKVACTNRTYLSRYINSEYQCSFRAWITQLRIEEAKSLLKANPELPVAEIAIRVGFASTESFSHIFLRREHVSPVKWREEN